MPDAEIVKSSDDRIVIKVTVYHYHSEHEYYYFEFEKRWGSGRQINENEAYGSDDDDQ